MGICEECKGTGVCHNGIHKTDGFIDDVLHAVTGWMYICDDCGEAADTPGDCPACDGTGECDD